LADNKVIKASMEEKLKTGVDSIYESAASTYKKLEADVERTKHKDINGNEYTTATYKSDAGREYDEFFTSNVRYYEQYDYEDRQYNTVVDKRIRKSTVDALVKSIANGNDVNSAFEILNAGIGANSAEAYVLAQ
jgi:hypothetical protein